ncbi:glycosyltransferase [Parapedobacter sp. SGR-10]|uniref:glycosyltransferase n=1 Tax=Parapedobacter sp. SGR-10 TaxID=2710879 RepID=UPI0013D590ED|nr:glycosyltransferase [Parapedobacter sp. SGR-10]NGF55387.1 glycosyltransferase [Parapedobacter sp. SGR-10]
MASTSKKGIGFLSTFPPRACGIATYTTDLMRAIAGKFHSFNLIPIPIESEGAGHAYQFDTPQRLDVSDPGSFDRLTEYINTATDIDMVCVQHEFGLFKDQEVAFLSFISNLEKPVVLTFHTVLPSPDPLLAEKVKALAEACSRVSVMTRSSASILINDYQISADKTIVIPHGTHLAPAVDKNEIRRRYDLTDRKILSTFGLLGPGKSIETTLEALPAIIARTPNVMFLILGMTHPALIQQEGEYYRDMLKELVDRYQIADHVRFVNEFLSTEDLLSYLQITDVYLFTSKDPLQAVSGTFSYALSSGCPIVSTPIPHVREVLKEDMGIMIGFEAPDQLAGAVNQILDDTSRLDRIRHINLQKMVATSWQNTALAHVNLFEDIFGEQRRITYALPPINLDHIQRMTTDIGFVQFANISTPDVESGYALDDNARALIAMLHHYRISESYADLALIQKYLQFIAYCIQDDGTFLNYVDKQGHFTGQNNQENLEDANGRAVWALGEVIGMSHMLPEEIIALANELLERTSVHFLSYHSTRSMSFTIKGLSFLNHNRYMDVLTTLADRLVAMFDHESSAGWQWYESYLTYGNSAIPEALLAAYEVTGQTIYQEVAYRSFDFLLGKIMTGDEIHVISNKGWVQRGNPATDTQGGEQPIDVAYTIIALDRFYKVSRDESYKENIGRAFDWFLGRNHLKQIVYNPVTGGCFDGLEEDTVNINQGAESTLSYLMARLIMEPYA